MSTLMGCASLFLELKRASASPGVAAIFFFFFTKASHVLHQTQSKLKTLATARSEQKEKIQWKEKRLGEKEGRQIRQRKATVDVPCFLFSGFGRAHLKIKDLGNC